MPAESKIQKLFPETSEKIILVASLEESYYPFILINFSDSLLDKVDDILKLRNYREWLSMSPKGHPPDSELQVLADLKTGELYSVKGRDREQHYDFFEPQEKWPSGAKAYRVSYVRYFGKAIVPNQMFGEEE